MVRLGFVKSSRGCRNFLKTLENSRKSLKTLENYVQYFSKTLSSRNISKQAGAELCQAQRGLKGCCEITSTFYIQFRQSFAKETFS